MFSPFRQEPQDSPDSPTTLEDIIEEERTRLMVADAVLGCTSVAINNDQSADDHAFVYADVIDLARKMIHQTTERLDSAYLRAFYEQITKARRDLSQIDSDAAHGMTITIWGHPRPLLTRQAKVSALGTSRLR